MIPEIDFWNLLKIVLSLLGGFWACLRIAVLQIEKRWAAREAMIDEAIRRIEETGKEEAGRFRGMERELLELKADLPRSYVRREDYIRGQATLEAKFDGLALKMENMLLKGIRNG